jgi:cytochrome c oxidase cbb3-type subunit 4
MEIYTFLRHMADSWGMLAMLLGFLGICLWALRPGSRALHDDAANSIFRNDAAPAETSQPTRKEA